LSETELDLGCIRRPHIEDARRKMVLDPGKMGLRFETEFMRCLTGFEPPLGEINAELWSGVDVISTTAVGKELCKIVR
jgi:hypothetical protein